ncbi:MAG: TVP38/TMEM64 family protein, partial [Anaeromyxobacteraceae bacterium]
MEAAKEQRRWVAITVAVASLAVVAIALLPLRAAVAALAGWGGGAGAAGVVAFAAAQVACTLLLVPAWPLRVAAGFVWGFAGGFALAMPTSLAGSVLAFLLARRVLRARVARRVAREPALAAIDAAVGARGFSAVLLLRLSPVLPNEAVNYALGVSRVRLRDYLLASGVGMVPTVASAVAAGSLATAAADLA